MINRTADDKEFYKGAETLLSKENEKVSKQFEMKNSLMIYLS